MELVERLLELGSDLRAKNKIGADACFFAASGNKPAVVTFLLDRGADPCTKSNNWTMLGWASYKGYQELCVLLIFRGADLLAVMRGTGSAEDSGAIEVFGVGSSPLLSLKQKEQGRIAMVATSLKLVKDDNAVKHAIIAEHNIPVRATTSLLLSDNFSDLVFVAAGGERIPAHRCILAASSEHMAALLHGQWKENAGGRESVVKLEQSGVAVRAMLRFVYTGHVDDAALTADLSGVLDLASQNGLEGLRAACEQHGVAVLTVKTVVPLAVVAHLYDLLALKAACIGLIKASTANTVAVAMSKSFRKLSSTHPLLWRELKAALGLPEEEEREDEEDG